MNPLKVYDYLLQCRERVFDAVRPLSQEQYHREFPIGLKTIASTLTHIMVSEWYYIERLEGRTLPPYEQWPIKYESPPETFAIIEAIWREQGRRIRTVIARADGATLRVANHDDERDHGHDAERRATDSANGRATDHATARATDQNSDWSRTITWLSFPDDTRGNKRFRISCTAGDMFTQLTLHEVHHRAQIMMMLRLLGGGTAIVEDIDYNALMYQRVETESLAK